MKRLLWFFSIIFCTGWARAEHLTGTIRDEKGNALAYASILVKGTTRGVTAGSDGRYSIELSRGEYTIICQYVGYERQEKHVSIADADVSLNFQLARQQLSMAAVVVRPGGEDPAYEIIRHAIKKRRDYENPLDSFTVEAYIKTLIRSRGLPNKIFGQRIEANDKKDLGVDSAGKGIIYLSESLTKVAFKRPNKIKLEVLSGRESGSNGFGFTIPTFINFYSNNVNALGDQMNPRGYVSPIADGALNYYRYKFMGSFFVDGQEINEIQVIPRRKFEPVFSGTIDIMEGSWRIYSLDLRLVKESQLQILDTLEIKQIHAPVAAPDNASGMGSGARGRKAGDTWLVKNQVIYFTFNILGFDAVGNFLDVYNNYDVAPVFKRRFFNNVLMHYDTAGNKKTKLYWDSIRPVPLEPDEKINYIIRDSIYAYNRDSMGTGKNRDSLLKKQGHVTAGQILFTGFDRSDFRQPRPLRYSMDPLVGKLNYNTVEGIDMEASGSVRKTLGSGRELSFSPHIRYGFHNTHLNPWAELTLTKRSFSMQGEDESASRTSWTLAGGRQVAQYNPDDPISPGMNSLYTLLDKRNYMKIYEKYFVSLRAGKRFDNGMRLNVQASYEDRMPIDNTTNWSLIKFDNRAFTPNYPVIEQSGAPFYRHQAVLTTATLQYQPGQRFIEFPDRKMSIGSKYPTFAVSYTKGWEGILGSDVNFDKWQFSVWDGMNFKLLGLMRYKFAVGGFLNAWKVFAQDFQHFDGNQTIAAGEYLNSFQLAPYYTNSTTASFYATGHIEHHFNGLLTNKIPVFRRWNWNLVGGVNAFYIRYDNHYEEMSWGLENIFKILRVDFVMAWMNGSYYQSGVRIGFGGLFGDAIRQAGRRPPR